MTITITGRHRAAGGWEPPGRPATAEQLDAVMQGFNGAWQRGYAARIRAAEEQASRWATGGAEAARRWQERRSPATTRSGAGSPARGAGASPPKVPPRISSTARARAAAKAAAKRAVPSSQTRYTGPTPLDAAMRAGLSFSRGGGAELYCTTNF